MPSLVAWFWLALASTLLVLVATVFTGLRRRRRTHLVCALAAVALLTVTVVLAERMTTARSFPPDAMRIHLWFAKSAALMVLPVAAAGAALWRRPRLRVAHRIAVVLFLLLAVIATGTGIWVFQLSTPK